MPSLVILDVTLPEPSHIRICHTIRQLNYHGPILMLSINNTVADRVAGLDAGADDFLGKPFDNSELLARIRVLLRRGILKDSVTKFGDLEIDMGLYEARRQGEKIHLSRIEYDLLTFFMDYPQQVLGRSSIMEHVWGAQLGGYGNSLDVYISRLRRKLGSPPLIHTVRSMGYILVEAPP
jgi:DNA-binding response OmpR family regulator